MELTSAERTILITALDDYIQRAEDSAVYCAATDQPDLQRMWRGHKELAEDIRKRCSASYTGSDRIRR